MSISWLVYEVFDHGQVRGNDLASFEFFGEALDFAQKHSAEMEKGACAVQEVKSNE